MKQAVRLSAIGLVLLVALSAMVLGGCGGQSAGPQGEVGSNPASPDNLPQDLSNIKNQANDAARQANLLIINNAIQMYIATEDNNPTSINQLVPQYLPKVPTDPAGGTYYIQVVGGQAKAAVQ